MLKNTIRISVFLLVASLCLPAPAMAQDASVSRLLVRLLQDTVRLARPGGTAAIDHSAHFAPGADQEITPFLFNQALVAQLSRIPLGSSSGGFTFTFDPAVGTFTRSTPTFGPSFAERAVGIGKGKLSFGFSFQAASYDGFEGQDLKNGEIKFYLGHVPFATPPAFFEGDLIEETLSLDLSTRTSTIYGSYGITDRLDVAVAIPIVNVKLDANVDALLLRLATSLVPDTHRFENGTDRERFSDSASASGLGDVLIRSKYVFKDWGGGGLAGGVDLRLPTGDEDELLGTGALQTTVMFIASKPVARFAPHLNVGYTFSGDSDNALARSADEFLYTIGTEFEASPRVTVNADIIGRVLRDVGRLSIVDKVHTFTPLGGTPQTQTFQEFAAQPGNLSLATGSLGLKVSVANTFLVSAGVLFPLTKAGVYDKLTPVIGIDYVF